MPKRPPKVSASPNLEKNIGKETYRWLHNRRLQLDKATHELLE